MSRDDEVAARADAAVIRSHMRSAAESIIEVGLALKRQKERLPHGSFLPWIEAEFGMSEQTARNFMNVAKVYAGKSPTVGDLGPGALYELAAPSTSQAIRDHVEALVVDEAKVTAADVLRLKEGGSAERLEASNDPAQSAKLSEASIGNIQRNDNINPTDFRFDRAIRSELLFASFDCFLPRRHHRPIQDFK